MSQKVYKDSPFGTAIHPHCLEPDTKFNTNGLFKSKVRYEGEVGERFKADIDAQAQAAFDDFMENGDGQKLTPAERKKFTVYSPVSKEEDDEGNPTGAVIAEFKQNAKIKLRDGTVKDVLIGIYDAAGKPMKKDFGSGSVIRVNYSVRPIVMKSLKQVGVRLDFGRVQVKNFVAKGSGDGGGFGAVEGYEDDGVEDDTYGNTTQGGGSADY